MNCPSCGGRATISNGPCTACGVLPRTAAREDVWTRAIDSVTAAGLTGAAYSGSAAPPDAPTDAGYGPNAPTGSGFFSADTVTRPALDLDAATTLSNGTRTSRAAHEPSPTGPLSPGQPFGARYHIVRLLGIGGMGAVYQAWDAELGVIVALKVIRPEVAADPAAAAMLERRFKQELLLARQVTHKNVVRIHELGELDGIKFITMSVHRGRRAWPRSSAGQDKLPIERVMQIARGIATGLEAAHAAGVVHRDLKPANIMVDKNDDALIMDFGIARSTGGPRGAGRRRPLPSGRMPAARRSDDGRRRRRHRPVHGARAGTGEAARPACGHLRVRLDCLRHAAQPAAGPWRRHRDRGVDAAHAGGAAAAALVDPTFPSRSTESWRSASNPTPRSASRRRRSSSPRWRDSMTRGHLLPVARRVTRRLVAAVGLAFVACSGVTWWLARGPAVPVEHEPVSVLIADFQNATGDAASTARSSRS